MCHPRLSPPPHSHVYHIIRPGRAPGFAYSWLELISHRSFIAKLLLQTPQQKGWPLFHQLLIDLFKFLAPFLRNAELTKPTQTLYKVGVLSHAHTHTHTHTHTHAHTHTHTHTHTQTHALTYAHTHTCTCTHTQTHARTYVHTHTHTPQGTLRVLLVLLHDFPEFLCDYHFSFCDVIPPNCIQMRNLILSAFPRNMRLPDPFTPNLKVSV